MLSVISENELNSFTKEPRSCEKGKYFGEFVHFEDENQKDKEDAKHYLLLWKKFFSRKIQVDFPDLKEDGEEWIERPAILFGVKNTFGTLGIKIRFKKKGE